MLLDDDKKKNAISLHDWRVHANRHKSAVDVTDSDSANQRKGIMTLKCVCVCVRVCMCVCDMTANVCQYVSPLPPVCFTWPVGGCCKPQCASLGVDFIQLSLRRLVQLCSHTVSHGEDFRSALRHF